MFSSGEFLRSVELVWAAWILGVAMLIVFQLMAKNRRRGLTLRRILLEEGGGAYSFTYVLVAPIYMLLLCLIIESTLLLMTKMGSMYAAYCAARSAVVWLNASPPVSSDKIRLAAVHAMVPFASSNPIHEQGGGGRGGQSGEYISAYRSYSRGGPATADYLGAKYRYAERATQVQWSPHRPTEDENVTVTVHYEFPFNVPGVGRILGHVSPLGGGYYTYSVTSKIQLPNEGAKGADQQPSGHPMGIDYYSF